MRYAGVAALGEAGDVPDGSHAQVMAHVYHVVVGL